MVNREGTFVCQSFESESFSDLLIRSVFLGSDWTFQNFKGKKPLELGLFFFFLKISINTISMYVFVDGICLVIFINNRKSQGSFSCVLQNFILYMYFLYWWVFGFYGGQRGGLDFAILLFVFNLEFVSEVALDLAILVF